MLKLLFLPGAIFLLVVFFRVVLPYVKTAPWKRLIDNARYYRQRDNFRKSDELIEKAVEKYPEKPQVYLDFFLNHSDSEDLEKRFKVLLEGHRRTGDVILAFFAGSAYLENGMFDEAFKLLDTADSRAYMLKKGTTLIPEIHLERKEYEKAEQEFAEFYGTLAGGSGDLDSILSDLSPQDLITLAVIRKASGKDYLTVMEHASKSSVRSEMGWTDLLSAYKDKLDGFKPAKTGISGDPGAFNRRRRDYFQTRIDLIESYL